MPELTPIYTALKEYQAENGLRLHMPGHVGGKGITAPELQALAGLDVTEVAGLDDLHLPRGVIAAAQQLMASACGAAESIFLVNGATSGIHALLLSGAAQKQVIIPRNAHRAFYGGLVLSGAMPVYLPCELEPELGIALAVKPAAVEAVLQMHPDAGDVFVTSPSYYGTCSDLAEIAAVTRRWDKCLLVDEAHGAHFPFHPGYPNSALQQGAAAAVNGLHKTWPVLTQGACLHLGTAFPRRRSLRAAFDLLTTSSPSYLLLAGIDLARAYMQSEAGAGLERGLELSREFKPRMEAIAGIRCHGEEMLHIPGVKALDPLKVLISLPGISLTGMQLGQLLREEFHIQVEIAEPHLILAMFSLLQDRSDWERFYLALRALAYRYPGAGRVKPPVPVPPAGETVLSPRQAFFAAKRRVRLADSRGKVAAELVAAYPPGIPCLWPGERISPEVWDYLHYLQKTGTRVQGPEAADLEHIIIIDEEAEG